MRGPWHFITCEYPPAVGGVSDFSRSLARALARRAEQVDVWAPEAPDTTTGDAGVRLHALPGGFGEAGLRHLSAGIGGRGGDRHLFVHWVPHGYGARGMNLRFCRWVRDRAAAGDRVTVMVHEPFLPLPPARLRHLPIALMQRRMMRTLLDGAARACVSTTAWLPMLRSAGLRPEHAVVEVPIASSVLPERAPAEVASLAAGLRGNRRLLVGHFGSFHDGPPPLLAAVCRRLLQQHRDVVLVLIGSHSDDAASRLARDAGAPAGAVVGSGTVAGPQLSRFIQACDLFVQPYVDGVTTRRSTLATLLAHAAPVVTTRGPLTEPEWTADPPAVVTSPVDADAIVEAAASLLGDAGARSALAQRARILYAARFDIDRTAGRLLAA